MSLFSRMRFIYVLLCFFVLSGCKTKLEDRRAPKGLLDREDMMDVLVDIHLAESKGKLMRVTDSVRNEKMRVEYARIFKIHGIDEEKYRESFDWYFQNPVVLEKMYDEIIEMIATQEQYLIKPDKDSIIEEPPVPQPAKNPETTPLHKFKNPLKSGKGSRPGQE